MRNKILVIGANSFLAQKLIQVLKNNGEEVFGLYYNNVNNLKIDVSYFPISELDNCQDNFDYVYIISGFLTSVELSINENVNKLFDANVKLIEKVCSHFQTAKVILASTVSVYGYSERYINETDYCKPDNFYGVSKLWGELVLKTICRKYSILRISPLYGIGMKENTFIPLIIDQALKNNNIILYGDGSRAQNYMHVDDAVNYLLLASKYPENEIFLACANNSISNLNIAQIVKKYTNCKIAFSGEDNSNSIFYNNELTTKKLNFTPEIRIEEGLKHLIEWKKGKY